MEVAGSIPKDTVGTPLTAAVSFKQELVLTGPKAMYTDADLAVKDAQGEPVSAGRVTYTEMSEYLKDVGYFRPLSADLRLRSGEAYTVDLTLDLGPVVGSVSRSIGR